MAFVAKELTYWVHEKIAEVFVIDLPITFGFFADPAEFRVEAEDYLLKTREKRLSVQGADMSYSYEKPYVTKKNLKCHIL